MPIPCDGAAPGQRRPAARTGPGVPSRAQQLRPATYTYTHVLRRQVELSRRRVELFRRQVGRTFAPQMSFGGRLGMDICSGGVILAPGGVIPAPGGMDICSEHEFWRPTWDGHLLRR